MRIIADTNTVVSGLLWHGAPRRILDEARAKTIALFTSTVLLAEHQEVLLREKFAKRLARVGVTARPLVIGYAALARTVRPASIAPVIADDPDDDEVLACAIAAQAEAIVSGDSHLIDLEEYRGIPIRTASELLGRL